MGCLVNRRTLHSPINLLLLLPAGLAATELQGSIFPNTMRSYKYNLVSYCMEFASDFIIDASFGEICIAFLHCNALQLYYIALLLGRMFQMGKVGDRGILGNRRASTLSCTWQPDPKFGSFYKWLPGASTSGWNWLAQHRGSSLLLCAGLMHPDFRGFAV